MPPSVSPIRLMRRPPYIVRVYQRLIPNAIMSAKRSMILRICLKMIMKDDLKDPRFKRMSKGALSTSFPGIRISTRSEVGLKKLPITDQQIRAERAELLSRGQPHFSQTL